MTQLSYMEHRRHFEKSWEPKQFGYQHSSKYVILCSQKASLEIITMLILGSAVPLRITSAVPLANEWLFE